MADDRADEIDEDEENRRIIEEVAKELMETPDDAGEQGVETWEIEDETVLAEAMRQHAQMTPLYDEVRGYNSKGGDADKYRAPIESRPGGDILFDSGAEDGIYLYHFYGEPYIVPDLERIIETASAGDVDRAFAQAHVVAQYGVMVRYVDNVCTYVDKNGDRLRAQPLYQLARRLVYQGTMVVAVKIGLAILLPLFAGRAGEPDVMRETVQLARTFGTTDEFAYYVIRLAETQPNGNDLIFDIARAAKGWGRVHAVHHLKPADRQIELWLLAEGVHNDVLWNYSAFDCYYKSGFEEKLAGSLSRECFTGAGDILDAYLDGEPECSFEHTGNALRRIEAYVSHAEKRVDLNDHDRAIMARLADYVAEKNPDPDLEARLRALAS